jgi:hypothetical protein
MQQSAGLRLVEGTWTMANRNVDVSGEYTELLDRYENDHPVYADDKGHCIKYADTGRWFVSGDQFSHLNPLASGAQGLQFGLETPLLETVWAVNDGTNYVKATGFKVIVNAKRKRSARTATPAPAAPMYISTNLSAL